MNQKVRILGVVGSPRPKSNTEILVREALDASGKIVGVETSIFTLHDKRMAPCIGCLKCYGSKTICTIKDDFQEFFNEFKRADGVIIGSPVYLMSVPSKLKACMERLSNSIFSIYRGRTFPRLCKTIGVISQGNRIYGGQEIVHQYIINAFVSLKCLVVSADFPDSYIGVGGHTFGSSEGGSITKNQDALRLARDLGVRVSEMSKIIKNGRLHLKGELPEEYFYEI